MKAFLVSFAMAALVVSVGSASRAADSPWSGTWKLDNAKSKLTGTTFTYAAAAGGKMTFSDGSTSFTFACDGKPYQTIPGEAVTCTKSGSTTYAFSYTDNGKASGTETDIISANGSTYASVALSKDAHGDSHATKSEFTRIGTGDGLVGTWKSTKTQSSTPETFTLAATATTISYSNPFKADVAMRLDGTPSALTGPTVPKNIVLVTKPAGPSKINFVIRVGGKITNYSTWTVSADRKTLTWIGWSPGKKNEATSAVYEKQ